MGKISTRKARLYEEYQIINEDTYLIRTKTPALTKLPAGAYKAYRDYWGSLLIESLDMVSDELLDLDGSVATTVLKDIKDFCQSKTKAKYKKGNFLYKRGVLLYGPHGAGKSSVIAQVVKDAIENDYIVLMEPDPHDLRQIMDAVRDVEYDRFAVVVWEDLDQWISHSETSILSLLDGRTQIENVLYLATTNYLDKIPPRIKNRPSRFAKVVEIGLPGETQRSAFLKAKLGQEDAWMLELLTQLSKGMSFDACKELVLLVTVYDIDPEEAAKQIKNIGR